MIPGGRMRPLTRSILPPPNPDGAFRAPANREGDRMKNLLLFVIVIGSLAYGMLHYHFILMDKSFKVLKKSEITLEDTFVDARGAARAKLLLNPALLRAGIKEVLRQAGN